MEMHRRSLERYGHPDIAVWAGEPHGAGAEWLLDYVESSVAAGTRFAAGDTVQAGWVTVMIEDAEPGLLEVMEPDFASMPVAWVPGARNTLRFLMIQQEVCRQAGVDSDHASMLHPAAISPGFLANPPAFRLSRESDHGKLAGWQCRESGDGGGERTLCSLYQVACSVPAIIPFMGLPPGAIVAVREDAIEIAAGGRTVSSRENEFLRQLLQSAFLRRG